ncbi:hypothetical protein [Streptomyces bikiniensis]|uniref:hypothetical protein n=1 Tax=Streptomyces bikiniensis TaxID=1896 RepID=UPI0005278C21|nr:hypothetical protein [Streptomyces bikiniensis]
MPFIRGYTKQDGTPVRAHWRAPAGTHKQTVLAIGIVAAVFVFGSSGTTTGSTPGGGERLPAPWSSSGVTYPIKWPGREKPAPRKAPVPTPTVSYPIRWPGWKQTAPRPVPTVSYPIKWDRSGGER